MTDVRIDKQDIGEVILGYSTGIDRRDWDLFRNCFTADCECDYGEIGSWKGADAFTDYNVQSHSTLGYTMHSLSNLAVQVDGDRAVARTYVNAWIMSLDGQSGFNPHGFYDDELIRTSDGWRIAKRQYTMVHFGLIGPPAKMEISGD